MRGMEVLSSILRWITILYLYRKWKMNKLYLEFEQLRDIINGRETYTDDNDWAENIYAQLKIVDDEMESVYSSALDLDLD